MTELEILNQGIDPKFQMVFGEDFAPITRGLVESVALRELTAEEELFYFRLLLVVDHWGNCPADPESLNRLLYFNRCPPGHDTILFRLQALKDRQLLVTYTSTHFNPHVNIGSEYLHVVAHITSGSKGRPMRPKYPTHPSQPNYNQYKSNRRDRQIRRQTSPQQEPNGNIEQEQEQEQEQKGFSGSALDLEVWTSDKRDPQDVLLDCLACRRFAAVPEMHAWAQLNVARLLHASAVSWPSATRERTRRILAHYDLLPAGKVDLDVYDEPPQDARLFPEIPKAELLGDLEGLDL